jgi:hypothetical protein
LWGESDLIFEFGHDGEARGLAAGKLSKDRAKGE